MSHIVRILCLLAYNINKYFKGGIMQDYKDIIKNRLEAKESKIDWLEVLGIIACIPLGYIFTVILFTL